MARLTSSSMLAQVAILVLLFNSSKLNDARGLSKYLPFLSKEIPNNPVEQLGRLLTSKKGPKADNSELLLKVVEDYVTKSSESKRVKNEPLLDFARQFLILQTEPDELCKHESIKELKALFNVIHEGERHPIAALFEPISDPDLFPGRRKLGKVFNDVVSAAAAICLQDLEDEWSLALEENRMISSGWVKNYITVFEQQVTKAPCNHRYESSNSSIRSFDCVLQEIDVSLSELSDAPNVYQALEIIHNQYERDNPATSLKRKNPETGENEAKSDTEIEKIIEDTLCRACDQLMNNDRAQRVLGKVIDFAGLVPMTENLFNRPTTASEQLIIWASRMVICRRLLLKTDKQQLVRRVGAWAELYRRKP